MRVKKRMPRPIKFRALFEGIWHYFGLFEAELPLIERETVGQFTGLTDKNGRECYEGDIIEMAKGWRWVMKWGDELARFYLLGNAKPGMLNGVGEQRKYIMETSTKVRKGEIIGNIYENPELLNHE